jgi:hypothetical protein
MSELNYHVALAHDMLGSMIVADATTVEEAINEVEKLGMQFGAPPMPDRIRERFTKTLDSADVGQVLIIKVPNSSSSMAILACDCGEEKRGEGEGPLVDAMDGTGDLTELLTKLIESMLNQAMEVEGEVEHISVDELLEKLDTDKPV